MGLRAGQKYPLTPTNPMQPERGRLARVNHRRAAIAGIA
jgi:hypothetical protein